VGIPQPFLGQDVVGIEIGFVRISCVILERPLDEIPLLLVREQVWDIDKTRVGFKHVCRLGKPVAELDVDVLVGESGWVAFPAPVQDLV
jgi:hypothetical protein